MDYKKLLFETQNRTAWITMNSLSDMNTFNEEMSGEMEDALDKCALEPEIRSVVITSGGQVFSGGGDVKYIKQKQEIGDYGRMAYQTACLKRLVSRIRQLKKPVIASVNGAVAGGACGLVMMCDFQIFSENAKLIAPFLAIGLVPDMGAVPAAMHHLTPSEMSDFIYLGKPISAKRALELGMINDVVPSERLKEETSVLALRLAELPMTAFGRTKTIFNQAYYPELERLLEMEVEFQSEMLCSEDSSEGVSAFLEKRKPKFK